MYSTQPKITIYGTTWCGDCRRAKRLLDSWKIPYADINIDRTPGAAEQVMAWANGRRVVPTITVGDRVLVNPGNDELAEAVGAMV